MRRSHLLVAFLFLPFISPAQHVDRVTPDNKDSSQYYLVSKPREKARGAIILLSSFLQPEDLLSETKLHNVAYSNEMLMVYAPMMGKIFADDAAVAWLQVLLKDVTQRFSVDTSKIVVGGLHEAGAVALRFTEYAYENPGRFPIRPKAVFGVDCPADLLKVFSDSEGQIKKNYWPGAVGDAKFYLDLLQKDIGNPSANRKRYLELTPFDSRSDSSGNERHLKDVALRLYFDTDINWQLKARLNSYNDTRMPEGSEMIKRLMLAGNKQAEFISAKHQGMRSNGTRDPGSLSIIDEVEFVVWSKRVLDIFDPVSWVAPYQLDVFKDWGVEHFSLPADFAPDMKFAGVEDIRFAPGWGDHSSKNYWSYAYIWWLEKQSAVTEKSLQQNLASYYTGLVNRNILSRKIPAAKQVPTMVVISKIQTLAGDLRTYEGKISMLDYMELKPMVLNVMIHEKACTGDSHQALFIELSPLNKSEMIWKEFRRLQESFTCKK